MKHLFPAFFLLFIGIMASSCHSEEWQNVKYTYTQPCDSLDTENTSFPDMSYAISCNVYLQNDTLVIFIPHESPGSWRSVTVKVHNGKFIAETDGMPFEPLELSFLTVKQQLSLNKKQYAINDTICGDFDIVFRDTEMVTKRTEEWNFKGTLCEIVRSPDFNPFDKANFMQFDLTTAIHEIGEPMDNDNFDTSTLPEFRVELLDRFPASKDQEIKELTWDSSDTREISDEGKERLTIWYAPKNGKWLPIHYKEWKMDEQF